MIPIRVIRKLLRIQSALLNRLRRLYFALNGIKLSSDCVVSAGVSLSLGFSQASAGEIYIERKVQLEKGVILSAWGGKICIRENTFIGPYTVVYGHGKVEIGKDTLISMHCRIVSSNHTIPEQIDKIRGKPDLLLPVSIGSDVWLGAGVTVLGGVTIGDGCVIGAGSVVSRDLLPYSIASGVPAKVIRIRPKGNAVNDFSSISHHSNS